MRKLFFRGVIATVLLFTPNLFSQAYKDWFIHGAGSFGTACGMVHLPVYNDSLAKGTAFLAACAEYVQFLSGTFTVQRGYSKGESGAAIEYSFPSFSFDTAMTHTYSSFFRILDSMRTPNLLVLLVGPPDYNLEPEKKLLVDCRDRPLPAWAVRPPADEGHYYAVGISEKYYSEMSSWLKAQESALNTLALSLHAEIKALDAKSSGLTAASTEASVLRLRRVEIIGRFFDTRNSLFYVLIRMHKK